MPSHTVNLPRPVFSKTCKRGLRKRIEATAYELGQIVANHFLAQPCSRCQEFEMVLLAVSPNARSIHFQCVHCKKRTHAAASTPHASEAARINSNFQSLLLDFNRRYRREQIDVEVRFLTPEAPLPFEQTRREPITQPIRTEVWRRDGGRCVRCDLNENLEYDHIIPVSRGGATSVRNLQLLCKGCNLSKGAKI